MKKSIQKLPQRPWKNSSFSWILVENFHPWDPRLEHRQECSIDLMQREIQWQKPHCFMQIILQFLLFLPSWWVSPLVYCIPFCFRFQECFHFHSSFTWLDENKRESCAKAMKLSTNEKDRQDKKVQVSSFGILSSQVSNILQVEF